MYRSYICIIWLVPQSRVNLPNPFVCQSPIRLFSVHMCNVLIVWKICTVSLILKCVLVFLIDKKYRYTGYNWRNNMQLSTSFAFRSRALYRNPTRHNNNSHRAFARQDEYSKDKVKQLHLWRYVLNALW